MYNVVKMKFVFPSSVLPESPVSYIYTHTNRTQRLSKSCNGEQEQYILGVVAARSCRSFRGYRIEQPIPLSRRSFLSHSFFSSLL